jgi:hypothetical protein
MRLRSILTAAAVLAALTVSARADDKAKAEAKGKEVEYTAYPGYFEKNDSGLKGDASYLAISTPKLFDATFGIGFTMGKKPDVLPKDAFDSKVAAAVIKRGKAITEYKVEKVTADDDTLYVQYTTTEKGGGGTAMYASSLIVAVDKAKLKKVVFIENGKEAGTGDFTK